MNTENLTQEEIAFKIKFLEEGINRCLKRTWNSDLCKNRQERVKLLKSYLEDKK